MLIWLYLGVKDPVSPPIPPPPNVLNPPSAYVVNRKLCTIKLAKADTPAMPQTPTHEEQLMELVPNGLAVITGLDIVKKALLNLQEETRFRLSESLWLWCCPPCSPFSSTSVQIWRSGNRWLREQYQQSSRPGRLAAELKVKVYFSSLSM